MGDLVSAYALTKQNFPNTNVGEGKRKLVRKKVVTTNKEQINCTMGLANLWNVSRTFSRPSPTVFLALPKGT